MKLELQEHEIEQAIEVFISSFVTGHPVKVNGFDLQGMRSKSGLTAMVDFDVLGVSDVRPVKTDSPNVNPTNTSWRENQADSEPEQEPETNLASKPEAYFEVLELLSDNPDNKNKQTILDLLKANEGLEKVLEENAFAKSWLESNLNQEEPSILSEEEQEMDNLILANKDSIFAEEVSDEDDDEEPVEELVKPSVLDEVTEPEDKQVTQDPIAQTRSLFGSPIQKNKPLFG